MRILIGVKPTVKQEKILDFIKSRLGDGCNPSLQDIADHIGCSSRNTVVGQLGFLERKGLVKRDCNGRLVLR